MIVLFGSGAAGRYCLRHLRALGRQDEHIIFADNNSAKWNTRIEGIRVVSPDYCQAAYPRATWVACAISHPAAKQLRDEIHNRGVASVPLWECLPVCHGLPPQEAISTLSNIIGDDLTLRELAYQCEYRSNPSHKLLDEVPPESAINIYFPEFITHLEEEVFVDCGAADGDTVKMFLHRWNSYKEVVAIEPDPGNFDKLSEATRFLGPHITLVNAAVGSTNRMLPFTVNGDYSSHLSGIESRDSSTSGPSRVEMVPCITLDDTLKSPPTYIKADIEGAELEMLWGAHRLISEHSPVLAICAYHTSDHLWQIPLLIHAINPTYELFLRRYGEGAFELVWYAVPPSRVKS